MFALSGLVFTATPSHAFPAHSPGRSPWRGIQVLPGERVAVFAVCLPGMWTCSVNVVPIPHVVAVGSPLKVSRAIVRGVTVKVAGLLTLLGKSVKSHEEQAVNSAGSDLSLITEADHNVPRGRGAGLNDLPFSTPPPNVNVGSRSDSTPVGNLETALVTRNNLELFHKHILQESSHG